MKILTIKDNMIVISNIFSVKTEGKSLFISSTCNNVVVVLFETEIEAKDQYRSIVNHIRHS